MRAHLVQLDIAWEDPEANYAKVLGLLDSADVTAGDLVLLPEMFDTGFSMETAKTADRSGRTLAFLAELAQDLEVTVQGGRTVHDCHCAKASNTASILAPGAHGHARLLAEYAKVHPFSIGKEHDHFEGGQRLAAYSWVGPGVFSEGASGQASGAASAAIALRVVPAICYDLRFPELFRLGLAQGAECFAVIACWLKARHAHWRILAQARAIENQAYVLAVNRTGRDPNAEYLGGSIAVSPTGEILGELGQDEGVLSVEVDPRVVWAWRDRFPAWKDGRLAMPKPVAGERLSRE